MALYACEGISRLAGGGASELPPTGGVAGVFGAGEGAGAGAGALMPAGAGAGAGAGTGDCKTSVLAPPGTP